MLEDDRLVGILTETDVLRAFAELFGARTPSTRATLERSQNGVLSDPSGS